MMLPVLATMAATVMAIAMTDRARENSGRPVLECAMLPVILLAIVVSAIWAGR